MSETCFTLINEFTSSDTTPEGAAGEAVRYFCACMQEDATPSDIDNIIASLSRFRERLAGDPQQHHVVTPVNVRPLAEDNCQSELMRHVQLTDKLKDVRNYTILVEFTRSFNDDFSCGGDAIVDKSLGVADSLRRQFCQELQQAYDEMGMAGSFRILSGPDISLSIWGDRGFEQR